MFDRSGLGAVVALFVLVVPFEKLFPRHDQRVRRPQVGTDVAHAIVSGPLGVVTAVVAVGVALVSLAWVPGLLLRPLVLALPDVPRTALAVVLFDVAVYWAHRFGHELPFLWRFHAIHHSTEHLDWISGFRSHPLDGAFLAPAFVLLVAAGFSPEVSGVLVVLQLVVGIFLHANVRWRLRPLHRLVATPDFHHWHHANEPDAINTNFSGLLPLWDLVFGTYHMPADRRPERYGVSEAVPAGLVAQLRHPVRGLGSPRDAARHPVRTARATASAVRRGVGQMARAARRTPWSLSPRTWHHPTPTAF